MNDETFVDKFFNKLGNTKKPSEKGINHIKSRDEKIGNIFQEISIKTKTTKKILSKFQLQTTTYYFLLFFILALISRALA